MEAEKEDLNKSLSKHKLNVSKSVTTKVEVDIKENKMLCCEVKTLVIVTTSFLLLCELIRGILLFGSYPDEKDVQMISAIITSGIIVVLCSLLYINVLVFSKVLACYIFLATTLMITLIAKVVLLALEFSKPCEKKTPSFETSLMLLVLIASIVQLYRIKAANAQVSVQPSQVIVQHSREELKDKNEPTNVVI